MKEIRWKGKDVAELVTEVTEEMNVEHLKDDIERHERELNAKKELLLQITQTPNRPE